MNILSGCTRLRFNSHINHACYAARHGYGYRFDITPRPLASVYDHKLHAILDCPVDGRWWFWIDDDAFFTRFDTPLADLGVTNGDELLVFPKSPVNLQGGWTYLSSGNFFFRSTPEVHAFFRAVLATEMPKVQAWWNAGEHGIYTGADQDQIVWNLFHDAGIRARTKLVPYEIFNTRPYHFSSATDCFLVHFAVSGMTKAEAIRQFQQQFGFADDALLPPSAAGDTADYAAFRVPVAAAAEPPSVLRRWFGR
ncbi:MAG TPA: hypothetical protein VNB23_01305 [Ramlibacter sp.]|nr:hypothetical protein [Ramlibacter sp.]